jgi:apolipoprotein N-acyltransferase
VSGLRRWLARPVTPAANLMLSAGCLMFGAAVTCWLAVSLLSVGKAGAYALAMVLLAAAAGAVARVLCLRWPRR